MTSDWVDGLDTMDTVLNGRTGAPALPEILPSQHPVNRAVKAVVKAIPLLFGFRHGGGHRGAVKHLLGPAIRALAVRDKAARLGRGIGPRLGDEFGARRPGHRRAGLGMALYRLRKIAQIADHRIKARRIVHRPRILGAEPVKPREVRQQQPAVITPPRPDQLAAIEHLLLHAFERPLGQHRLRMIPRKHQRRPPPSSKSRIPPLRQIDRRTRNPDARSRHPDIPMPG